MSMRSAADDVHMKSRTQYRRNLFRLDRLYCHFFDDCIDNNAKNEVKGATAFSSLFMVVSMEDYIVRHRCLIYSSLIVIIAV